MNSFLKWLGKKIFPQSAARSSVVNQAVRGPRSSSVTVRRQPPAAAAKKKDARYGKGMTSHIEDGGPGKNVYVRSKYVREDTGTHDTLKIVDESLVENEDEDGLDPYNSGRYDRSKSWNLRSGK